MTRMICFLVGHKPVYTEISEMKFNKLIKSSYPHCNRCGCADHIRVYDRSLWDAICSPIYHSCRHIIGTARSIFHRNQANPLNHG
jgi:hypothetical protein